MSKKSKHDEYMNRLLQNMEEFSKNPYSEKVHNSIDDLTIQHLKVNKKKLNKAFKKVK